jgi:uncharacterized Zn finger protein (UPF0148 family)
MAFTVPEELRFICLSCEGSFVVSAFAISGREELFCPFCGEKMNWLDALEEDIRQEVLVQIKEEVEELVDSLQGKSLAQNEEVTVELLKSILREKRNRRDKERA